MTCLGGNNYQFSFCFCSSSVGVIPVLPQPYIRVRAQQMRTWHHPRMMQNIIHGVKYVKCVPPGGYIRWHIPNTPWCHMLGPARLTNRSKLKRSWCFSNDFWVSCFATKAVFGFSALHSSAKVATSEPLSVQNPSEEQSGTEIKRLLIFFNFSDVTVHNAFHEWSKT